MHEWQSLSHVRWDCKYHVVIIPKYRRKVFYGRLRRQIGPILRDLCRQRGIELLEGHAMPDHVHLCLSIPPKYSVAFVLGFLKGKSAVRIDRELLHERRMSGLHFWAPGYCVSTVGLDEGRVRQYLREQEELENRQGELDLESPLTTPTGSSRRYAPNGGNHTETAPRGPPNEPPPPTGATTRKWPLRRGPPNTTSFGRG
jgi:putative transposase